MKSQRIADKFAGIDRSCRLDEGEGRDSGELEAAPGPLGARLDASVARSAIVGVSLTFGIVPRAANFSSVKLMGHGVIGADARAAERSSSMIAPDAIRS